MKTHWKILCILLLFYTLWAGMLIPVPPLPILHETIRNLFFHVTMWFTMIILMTISIIASIRYLADFNIRHDHLASESAKTGMLFGILGLITGSLWAKYTWGAWWVNDPKLNGAAAAMLVYLAYFLLRSSFEDPSKKAKISAVYGILAYMMMLVLILVLPRLTDSLHPGNGGNPGFGKYDLDNTMRLVFYPSIIGWALLGWWLLDMRLKLKTIENTEE